MRNASEKLQNHGNCANSSASSSPIIPCQPVPVCLIYAGNIFGVLKSCGLCTIDRSSTSKSEQEKTMRRERCEPLL
jgi:hypothetical protein